MKPVLMPQVGQDIPKGKILEWRKAEGDPVERGEIVLVVESEKASFEVEAEDSGVLLRILHGEEEEADVLKPVAYIGEPGEVFDEPSLPRDGGGPASRLWGHDGSALAEARDDSRPASAATQPGVVSPQSPRPGRILASPAARRAAGELGVAIEAVPGSGPGGRIIERDVLAASRAAPAAKALGAEAPASARPVVLPEDTVVPFDRMRRRIAERLSWSWRTVPHFYISVDVDMTRALELRCRMNEGAEVRVSVTDLVVKAAADSLAEFPRMNAHVGDDRVVMKKRVNVGVATAVEGGLLVPVIPDADRKDLREIARLSRRNAEAARRGSVDPNVVGSFTVSSLGMFGVREFIPVINPPECAILAVGAAEKRVAAMCGETGFCVRDMMTLTLACDHRAADGVYAAEFLGAVRRRLEEMAEGGGESASGARAGEAGMLEALIFDCDGVIADTERDGHRPAFNRAFAEKGLGVEWDVPLYGRLLRVGGGKERMRHFFEETGWPEAASDRDAFIKELHKRKTDLYMEIVESGKLPARPGVVRLVDEAISAGVRLAVCSTSNERAVNAVVEKLLGPERKARFDVILAGDVVSKKKPDPEIYRLARERLGVEPSSCVVVEDNRNGLLAAKAAGMRCIVTTNGYTEKEDFSEADAVFPELGDPPDVQVTIEDLKGVAGQ
jgi:pyruvate dehydrogenase E2 component (dihydrolipoamide acetyltransferase)